MQNLPNVPYVMKAFTRLVSVATAPSPVSTGGIVPFTILGPFFPDPGDAFPGRSVWLLKHSVPHTPAAWPARTPRSVPPAPAVCWSPDLRVARSTLAPVAAVTGSITSVSPPPGPSLPGAQCLKSIFIFYFSCILSVFVVSGKIEIRPLFLHLCQK